MKNLTSTFYTFQNNPLMFTPLKENYLLSLLLTHKVKSKEYWIQEYWSGSVSVKYFQVQNVNFAEVTVRRSIFTMM